MNGWPRRRVEWRHMHAAIKEREVVCDECSVPFQWHRKAAAASLSPLPPHLRKFTTRHWIQKCGGSSASFATQRGTSEQRSSACAHFLIVTLLYALCCIPCVVRGAVISVKSWINCHQCSIISSHTIHNFVAELQNVTSFACIFLAWTKLTPVRDVTHALCSVQRAYQHASLLASVTLLLTTGACDAKSCEGLKKVFEDDCMCVPTAMAMTIAIAVLVFAIIDDVPCYAT
jgi:hypothetical protein